MGRTFVKKMEFRGLAITLLLPDSAPADADFLPASVEKGAVQLWKFQINHPEYRAKGGLAKLVEMCGEYFIYLHRHSFLDTVIPIADMEKLRWVSSDLFYGGRKRGELIEMKTAIAEKFNFTPVWNEVDHEVFIRINARKEEERQRMLLVERIAREEAEEERRVKRQEEWEKRQDRKREILARTEIKTFTVIGNEYRRGIPVTMEERDVLPDNTRGILVESYDVPSGTHGDVIECFIVVMKGSRKEYKGVKKVYTPSSHQKKVNSTPFTLTSITINGVDEDVLLVESFEDVKALCDEGHTGVYVAHNEGAKRRLCFIEEREIRDVSLKDVVVAA